MQDDVIRRNLKSDYDLLVDIEHVLKTIKINETNAVFRVSLSEQIEKVKCVEYNIMQMMLLCLEDDQTFYDVYLKKG